MKHRIQKKGTHAPDNSGKGVALLNPLQLLEQQHLKSKDNVTQLTTVKVGTPKDQKDFDYGEPLLKTYLDEDVIPLMGADLSTLTGNQLNIWGHMDTTQIGGMSQADLAKTIVRQGYRSSNEIRLIGCNLKSKKSMISPSIFWNALQQELQKIGSQLYAPPVYATRGPLHTGGDDLTPEQRWFVEDKKHDDVELKRSEHSSEEERFEQEIETKKQKYASEAVTDAPGKVLEEFKVDNPDTKLTDGEILEQNKHLIAPRIKALETEYIDYYYKNKRINSQRSEMRKRHKKEIKGFIETKQKDSSSYPSIFKHNEEGTGWTWNEHAWVKYYIEPRNY